MVITRAVTTDEANGLIVEMEEVAEYDWVTMQQKEWYKCNETKRNEWKSVNDLVRFIRCEFYGRE